MRIFILCGWVCSMIMLGAEPEATPRKVTATLPGVDPKLGEGFEAKEWKADDGTTVLYRWSAPGSPEAGKKYPLVMFLHGSGERGTDNKAHLKHGVSDILKQAEALKEPCFLIAPQCPPELFWWKETHQKNSRLKGGNESKYMSAVLALVDHAIKEHPVDAKRFYVTGLSMGGFATWDLLAAAPDRIAAAIPICGGGDAKNVDPFKDVPIWAFHGEKDNIVAVSATREMIAALEAAGGKPKATFYPEFGHDSWTATYRNPEVIRWLFSQRK